MLKIKNSFKYHVWYKNVYKEDKMCVIAQVMFYENRTTNPMKVFRMLSCVLCSIMDNHVCIDYLCCKSKKWIIKCSDKIFMYMSYNYFLGIGITEVLMKFI